MLCGTHGNGVPYGFAPEKNNKLGNKGFYFKNTFK